jgi:hypothetical protein
MTRRDAPRSKTPTETLIKCFLVNPLSRADGGPRVSFPAPSNSRQQVRAKVIR